MAVPAVQHNTPSAGYISWSAFTIQIYGGHYTVAPGSTNQRWTWWRFNGGTAPVLEAGPDLPSNLTDDDLVLFANRSGIAFRVQSANFLDGELLVDGTILADAIAVNQINSNHIVTLGLDAGVIKFGLMSGDRISVNTLLGDRILANSLSVSKLSVASLDNIIEDPGFTQPMKSIATGGFWQAPGSGGVTIVAGAGRNGQPAMQFVADGASKVVFSPTFNPGPSKWYRSGYWIHATNAIPANSANISIRSRTAANATGLNSQLQVPALVANTWTFVTGMIKTADIPEDVMLADIRISITANVPAGTIVSFDAYPSISRANAGELTVDGTILAKHIKADEITSNEIKARSILATDIKANELTANEIFAQTITANELATNAIIARNVSADAILANAIKAGEIITAHMLVDSILGDRIKVNTLDAAKIIAGTITGDRINSTFLITGKTIKGGTILGSSIQTSQTANSGPRMEMNEDVDGGFIVGHTAPSGFTPSAPTRINPRILGTGNARRQSLYISSGSFGGGLATVDIVSGSFDSATPSRVLLDAGEIKLNGPIDADGNLKMLTGRTLVYEGYSGGGVTGASVNNVGAFIRTGSSRKLKQDIELLSVEEAKKVLDMEAVSFQWRPEQEMGDARQAGFIAEQTEEVGAELWLTRDGEGEASGVRYAEITAAHNVIIKDQQRRIEELEDKVERLLSALESS